MEQALASLLAWHALAPCHFGTVQLGTLVANGPTRNIGRRGEHGAERQALHWGGDPALPFVAPPYRPGAMHW